MIKTDISMDTIFGKNVHAIFSSNPGLGLQIINIQENKRFEVFQGDDPVAINFLDLDTNHFMYNNPLEDILAYAEHSDKQLFYPYRYFFGIANGVYLKMALQAPALRRAVVFEPNIELLYIVFNLIDFSEDLLSKKLLIDSNPNFDFTDAYKLFNEHESQLFARLFELESLSNYYLQTEQETYLKLTNVLTETLLQVVMGHGNCSIDSLMGIEHHFINLPDLIKGPKLTKIFGKGEGDTAIIVSTGPSLTKQLPLLKKIQNHATIISVDASFPILEKHNIKPDFVTVLERVPETGKFFEHNSPEFQKDVHFVCVSIIHEAVKNAIRTGNLILEMRPHGYTRYFGFDEYGYLGNGMSAANLAHELAVLLDFKNIIFIGQDLAFGEDNTSHAQDHTFTVNEEKTEGHDIFVTKYGGEGKIRTTFYWNIFRNTIQDTVKKTSSFITTINATEGGAQIVGALEIPFAEAIETYIDPTFVKTLIPLEYPSEDEIILLQAKMIEKTNYMLQEAVQKQEIIEDLFMKIQEVSETMVELNASNRLEEIDFDYLYALDTQLDTVKGFLEDSTFHSMFYDTIQSFMVHLEIDMADIFVHNPKNDIEKKAKLIDWIMRHRYWLFVFAGGLNGQFTTVVRAIQTWPDHLREQVVIPAKRSIEIDQAKYEKMKEKALLEEEQLQTLIKKIQDQN